MKKNAKTAGIYAMPAVQIHFIHLQHTNICVLCYGRNPSASTRFLSCCNSGGIISILYLCRFSATTALCDFGCSDTVSVIVFMISNYKLFKVYCFVKLLGRRTILLHLSGCPCQTIGVWTGTKSSTSNNLSYILLKV